MVARLSAMPPETRGLPAREDWEEVARPLSARSLPAPMRLGRLFARGGRSGAGRQLVDFPLAEAGPLSRGTIQVDPAMGLLGLVVRTEEGFWPILPGARRCRWRSTVQR
jgi:oligopeptide transport system substrate-binding protein